MQSSGQILFFHLPRSLQMVGHRQRRVLGVAPIAITIAACCREASLRAFAHGRKTWLRSRESTVVLSRGQLSWPLCTRQQRSARDVSRHSMPPGLLMKQIRRARTHQELFELSEPSTENLVHRAAILYQLTVVMPPTLTGGALSASDTEVGRTHAFRALLLTVIEDLRNWKASGKLKRRVDPLIERGRYLGNLIWSLGHLRNVLAIALSEDERSLLFEHATLAALQALPDLISRRQTSDLSQIVFGLKGTSRTLQTDAIFKSLASEFPTLLNALKGKARNQLTTNAILAYGWYAIPDPAVVDMFMKLKPLILNWDLADPLMIRNLGTICGSFGRYAGLSQLHVDPDDVFSVSFMKKGSRLGITMNRSLAQPAINITHVDVGLVRKWNNLHPEWTVQEGNQILKANSVSDNPQAVATEVDIKDNVTLMVRRGSASLEMGLQSKSTRQPSFLEALKADDMVHVLALQVTAEFQTHTVGEINTLNLINVLQAMVLLGIRSDPVVERLSSAISWAIPRLPGHQLAEILGFLSIKDVLNDPFMIQALASRALELLRRNQIHARSNEFFVILNALTKLSSAVQESDGNLNSESDVVRQFRKTAKQNGVTQSELDRFGVPVRWLLTGGA